MRLTHADEWLSVLQLTAAQPLTNPPQTERWKLPLGIQSGVRWSLPHLLLEEKRLREVSLSYALVCNHCLRVLILLSLP
ncbi:hypothetical protein [Leptospira harrisiae]|uniref:hypothetical protein n=1 Tax=Leptospira harrisiae TaxID=2023189 RepID=UPI000F63FF25|nr:hypothetical protein [Leptospira harrisiae]